MRPRVHFRYAVRPFLSLSLIAALLAPFALVPTRHSLAKSSQRQNNQGRPEPGRPAATLPNLNEIRTQQLPLPKAPPEIPSTLRSNRNPLAPRNGRKVGDPLPALGQGTAVLPAKNEQRRTDLTTKVVARTAVFHHVRIRPFSPPPLGDDQYVQSFFQSALARQPYGDESGYWADILRSAYAHAQTSMVMSARELGKTVFESAEYAARARNNHDYVYDLYWAYLLRAPDPGGWAYWEGQVPAFGREGVRRAFDESPEFASVVGTITPNGSASSTVSSLLTRRLEGINQPGSGLLSRDAEWSLPILSLPGRAGLDLGLALSYSSAVWTRSGPYIYFDDDNGFPSPGFRLGFPTVQELFFNAQAGQNAYLLITSGGNRIELRQIGTSNVYEAVDSSYLQLTDNGSSLLVRSSDGTQMGYTRLNNEWRCNQSKDRNGNYITVNYDWLGHITSIIDTLNRTITFNYDGNANLTSITQTWDGQTHYWATFGWDIKTMQSDVSGVAIVGAQNYTQIPVLTQVGLPDGFRYNFEYTNWLQASIFRRYSSTDNVQRAYTAVDYQYPPADCPRLANSRQWAVNWTGINGVPTEVVTQYFDPGDGSHYVIRPDGTVYQEFYGTGWQSGLVTTTFESAPATGIEKWTTTAWTQDDINLAYKKNPRPTESNVYDSSSNRRRTRMDYYTFTLPDGASCSLSSDVYDYASDGNNILRRTHTDYDLNPAYLSRRLIGLINSKYVYDGNGALQSKTGFYYDSGGGSSQWLTDNGQVTQHDYASYPKSFDVGRGNLCFVQRFDVTNLSVALTSGLAYDITGNVVGSWDPLSHYTSIGYNDSFSEGGNRNTFAYPTTVTDPDGFSTYTQYNYDFGAQTRVQGPPPQGQSQGIIQTTTYDNAARIDTLTTTNNGAYTRFWYGPDYAASFSSVNNVADELFTNRVFDGAGRLIGVSNSNPGSLGGYKARLTQYDLMGRVMKQSNPEEIDGWWTPYGDDAAGWLYTQQTYDWKGRPRITTNTDLTTKEASYSGCGCAGGEVATLTEGGRQQKIYSDVLGRTVKREVLNSQGGSVYSAIVNTHNALDQITKIRQYAGPEGSGTYQDTTTDYDGYGRLWKRHVPEQNAGASTIYEYFNDDRLQKVTDARGASATFGYDGTNRHLVKKITYAAPGGISVPGEVNFDYDAAGNRTSMTDGLGSTSYNYNELSRLTSETRVFTGVGTFPISYSYNLAGQLTSVTDPFGAQIGYVRDGLGRTTSITGSGFAGISSYVSNIQYRAWGAPKSVNYGNNTSSTTTYTARLKPWQFRLSDNTYGPFMREDYTYYNDGSLQQLTDLDDTAGPNPPATLRYLSRGYSYDNVGRVSAVGGTGAGIPLSQNYGYDAFGNMTSRSGSYYNYTGQSGQTDTASYTNNRRNGWSYDADGRVSSNPASSTDDAHNLSYDAAGRMVTNIDYAPNTTITYGSGYDGDGQLVFESSQFYSYSA